MTLKITVFMTAMLFTMASHAQEIEKNLKHFNRIVASPRVHVILEKGDTESIRVVYNNVSASKVNIDVAGRTLRIYLDNARKIEPMKRKAYDSRGREGEYEGVTVTAYVTYKELRMLEIRGEQELTCRGPIEGERFTLRAYGENEITLTSLKTPYFKAKLYGENNLRIKKGRTIDQSYVLYGENRIDAQDVRSDYVVTRIFGEGSLKINSSEEVIINAFGEPQIFVDGGAQVNRRLVFGKPGIFEE